MQLLSFLSAVLLASALLLQPALGTKLRGKKPIRGAKLRREEREYYSRALKGSKDSSSDSGIAGCFPEDATVLVEGTGPLSMKELKVGDSVLTDKKSYQPVYAFGHKNTNEEATYFQFTTSNKKSLEMTGDHLVFLQGKSNPVRADTVQIGDVLRTVNLSDATVTKIKKVTRKGLYAPFTPGGTVVVNDFLASSYISVQGKTGEFVELGGQPIISHHAWVHLGLSPMRLLCHGMSYKICEACDNEGIPYYASFAIKLNHWSRRQNTALCGLVLCAVFLLTGVCLLLETAVRVFAASAVMLFFGAFVVWSKKNCFQIRLSKASKKTV